MNCDRADELLGAYALDALSETEAADFRAHLATCAHHRKLAAEMRAISHEMPALADPMPPPAALRARILDAVRNEPQELAAPAAVRTAGAAAPRSIVRGASSPVRQSEAPGWRRGQYAWGALAAVIVAAIGGLLTWNVVLMNRLDDDGADAFASAVTAFAPLESATGESAGAVVYFGEDRRAVVVANDLKAIDAAEETYQLWAVTDGEAVSLGLLQPDASNSASMAFAYDAQTADAFAMTVEPRGGSDQPTSEPVYMAEL